MFSAKNFIERFQDYGRRRRLIEDGNRIIVGVSGGADSIVLLDLLAKIRERRGLQLIVAHYNFQLRGSESDDDERFVATRAGHYGIEFFVERANTAEYARHMKLGIQEAARNLRYDFFDKLLESSGFDRIATAHNADDNAETILLNLFRGAGVQGLSGIPVYRHDRKIVRPLLFALRREIELYAAEEGLEFRTDSSNEKDTYTRNFIRHRILPLVKEQVNPTVVQTLQRSAELFREMEAYISYNARASLDLVVTQRTAEEAHLSIPRLRSNPTLLQQHVVMLAAEQFAGKRLEFDQVNALLALTDGLTGSSLFLSEQHVVYRDRNELVMRKVEPAPAFKITVLPNRRYEFTRFKFSSELVRRDQLDTLGRPGYEFVDAAAVGDAGLVLRTWSDGDAFMPLGMHATKKISDFFVDAKIPVYEKHEFPILETNKGEVVWLCGQRIDERFKITDGTTRVLKLEFSRLTDRENGREHNR